MIITSTIFNTMLGDSRVSWITEEVVNLDASIIPRVITAPWRTSQKVNTRNFKSRMLGMFQFVIDDTGKSWRDPEIITLTFEKE